MSELGRRLHAARKHVSSPADALLLARMGGWALALPLLKRVVPLQRLVRLAGGPAVGPRDAEREQKVAELTRVLYRSRGTFVGDNCLERSLVAYRYLARSNAEPELVVGMGKDGGEFLGHVWVTVDGSPLYDAPERLADFVPMVVFDARGAPRREEDA